MRKRSKPDSNDRSRSLRDRAEPVYRHGHGDQSVIPPEQIPRIVQELEIHQIELEMQNEELRSTQRELEQSRDHLLNLYDFAPVGYFTLNENAVIEQANLRAASQISVARGTLTGQQFRQFLSPRSAHRFELYWRSLSAGPSCCELLLRRADGTEYWTSMEAVATGEPRDGRFWLCAVTDISTRKSAEEELQKSEQRLQSYLDHAGDAIYVLDSGSGRLLDANNRAVEMLGYSRDELLKLSEADIEAEHTTESICAAHARTCRETVQIEGVHRRKDGSLVPVEIRLTALQPNMILAIVRDITERKRAEEERAQDALRRDEFLALLGHELRNPLAAISAALEVLHASSPEERAEWENLIYRQVVSMRRLMDDLLDLGRIAHGHIELQRECIDLAEFLKGAAADVQSDFVHRSQEFLIRFPPEPVQFMADRLRLKQIAMNLLSNASKYTGRGGKIEFSGERDGAEVVLRCSDSGQGIMPQDLERIFEPFVTVGKRANDYGLGSLGLGLALVKQLTELHGGTVSAKSTGAGLGSEFIVRLPLVEPGSAPAAFTEPMAARPARRPRTIVVVEDNPDVAAGMKIALERASCQVHAFSDGPSVLAGVGELRPDAVVLDIGLPGMDGYALAAELKKRATLRDAVFVAISGFGRTKQAAGPRGNFDHYVTKPVDFPALLALIDQAIDRDREAPDHQWGQAPASD